MDNRAADDVRISKIRAADGDGLAFEIDILVIDAGTHQNHVAVFAVINRLLDGGVTSGGLPFLVMEYVEGRSLTQYCDAERLPLPRRLAIFQTICSAVFFAHQRLIVQNPDLCRPWDGGG